MADHGDWGLAERIFTSLLDGNLIAIAVATIIAFGVPVLLHFIFYQTVASPPLSNFLLLGPSGAGKTALLSLVSPTYSKWLRSSMRTIRFQSTVIDVT
jgi:signal recognition particle receptor subunit beta